LPPGRATGCYLSSVQALPLVKAKCRNPTFSIAGKSITFPIDMETGAYLEFKPPANCRLYAPDGALLAEVSVRGEVPTVPAGESQVSFGAETDGPYRLRARVTLMTTGPPLPN